MLKNFNIKQEAGDSYIANVTRNFLEVHFLLAGHEPVAYHHHKHMDR